MVFFFSLLLYSMCTVSQLRSGKQVSHTAWLVWSILSDEESVTRFKFLCHLYWILGLSFQGSLLARTKIQFDTIIGWTWKIGAIEVRLSYEEFGALF